MLYLHIGLPKTGSTTIQRFVTTHLDELARNNLIYPKLGRTGRAHFNIFHELRGHPLYRPALGGLWDVQAMLQANPENDYLLSAETFNRLNSAGVQKLAAVLTDTQVKLICYIRPLSSLVVSWYMQNAKMGYFPGDFDAFFERRAVDEEVEPSQFGELIFKRLRTWAGVFGWDAMRVRALDEEHLHSGDLLTDFLDALGLTWTDIGVVPAEDRESRNVSPGWKAVELMRLMHAQTGKLPSRSDPSVYLAVRDEARGVHTLAERFARELDLNRERGVYLTPEQAQVCHEAYGALVGRLNGVLSGPPIPEPKDLRPVERPFLPDAAHVPPAERSAFFERMAFALAQELRLAGERAAEASGTATGSEAAEAKREARKMERRRKKREARKAAKLQAEAAG